MNVKNNFMVIPLTTFIGATILLAGFMIRDGMINIAHSVYGLRSEINQGLRVELKTQVPPSCSAPMWWELSTDQVE